MSVFCLLEKKKNIEIVRLGFSWKAFLFVFFWGITNELWIYSIIWYFFSIFLTICFFYLIIDPFFLFMYFFATSLFWGFFGNQILIDNLTHRKDFHLKKVVSSSNKKEALFLYLMNKN